MIYFNKNVGRPKGKGTYGTSTIPVRVPKDLVQEVKNYSLNNGFKIPYLNSVTKFGLCYLTSGNNSYKIDVNDYLIKNPKTTFYFKVPGSMSNEIFKQGDMLLVDYSLQLAKDRLLIATIDGILTIRKINYIDNEIYLISLKEEEDVIHLSDKILKKNSRIIILGVITNIIRSV